VGRPCVVRGKDFSTVGYLFMETPGHVVLLNNVREGLDLGPVKPVRTEHVDPEVYVRVIPKSMVDAIDFLEEP
jgi:hypothetical protein